VDAVLAAAGTQSGIAAGIGFVPASRGVGESKSTKHETAARIADGARSGISVPLSGTVPAS